MTNLEYFFNKCKEMGIEVTVDNNPSEHKIQRIKSAIKKREDYMNNLKNKKSNE